MEKYQIIQPSPLLTPYVKHFWFLQTDIISQSAQRIIPTGNVSLVFHRGENLFSISKQEQQPQAFISGQSTGYSDIRQKGVLDMISVTFKPQGFKAFFAMPVNELFESTIAIEDMGDPALIELNNYLMEATDTMTCVHLIETFLIKRLNIVKAHNFQRLNAAIKSINAGEVNIQTLAEKSCLSYKQFKRIFSEYVGVNPKDFLRIIRFQRALYTLQVDPDTNLIHLLFDCGYYDQSHLTKEFKTYSGYTPGEYISMFSPYSDYFA